MIKMMIVDDEVVIRRGLALSINWQDYGVEIAGEASNGKEALEKALDIKPDIVITDILMPVMDGLELARQLKEKLPEIKVIILTGHNEFEYAKKAIDFKVCTFLLKPVGAEQLTDIVLKMVGEIEKEKEKRSTETRNRLLVNENISLIREKFINELINNKYCDEKAIIKKIRMLDLNLIGPCYQAILIGIDDYHFLIENLPQRERVVIFDSIINLTVEALQTYSEVYPCKNDMNYIIVIINKTGFDFNITDVCRDIQHLIKKHIKISVSIGIGNEYKGVLKIHESYNEAFIALSNRIYKGKNSIISINDIKDTKKSDDAKYLFSYNQEEKELIDALRLIDSVKVKQIIDGMFKKFINKNLSYSQIKNMCLKILIISVMVLEEMGVSIDKYDDERFDFYSKIDEFETIEGIRDWMHDMFDCFIYFIDNEKKNRYKSIVKVAIEYVQEHYNENINLSTISGIVYVTPNYFCRVFKEETGMNFVEWLNRYRIDRAKEYLEDVRLKTYEIAEKVGYNDYKYFSYNFKKYAGCAPLEYRKAKSNSDNL